MRGPLIPLLLSVFVIAILVFLMNVGDEKAPLLEEAVTLHEAAFPDSGAELANSLIALSSLYYHRDRWAESRSR